MPGHLTGTDLDADLLQGRTLDRRLELQCRARLAGVDVGLGVLGDLRDVARQRACLGEVRAGRRAAPSSKASQPGWVATKAMNFLAASSLSPSTDLGIYIRMPGQMVMPLLPRQCREAGRSRHHCELPGATFSMFAE